MSSKLEFLQVLGGLRTSSTFLNLHRYTNEHNEVANYNIVFHISYENALRRSVATLEGLIPDSDLQAEARHALLKSFHESIKKCQTVPIEEIDDAYTRFFDDNGQHIKGVMMHTKTGNLHLTGFAHQKVVLVEGVYPKRNSSPLTIEKEKLRRMCQVSKYRQFRILPHQVDRISVEKLSLLPPAP